MSKQIMALGFLLAILTLQAQATPYTNETDFINAINALGLRSDTDNYESYSLGPLTNGQILGGFRYSFNPNQTQPAIASDGNGGQALGGAPFDVFVGGDVVNLAFTGTPQTLNGLFPLRAFGAEFFYAPNFEPLPADLYQIEIMDGAGAGTTLGNPAGLDAIGGSFFLGFIEPVGFDFRQVSIFSAQPVDSTGAPYLTPAYQVDNLRFAVVAVPEPSSFMLIVVGLVLMMNTLVGGKVRQGA